MPLPTPQAGGRGARVGGAARFVGVRPRTADRCTLDAVRTAPPLRSRAMPGATHPVAAVLRERRLAGSRPGAREDPHRVALVLEGGGMRGVVSAGMTAALERLGLTPCFDLVVGASAGAINGAALIAGVAREGAAAYDGPLASRSFVNPARALRGRPVIDVNYVLEYASAGLDAGRHERVLRSPIDLHCVAVSVEAAETVTFSGMR